MSISADDEQRFWKLVDRRSPDECWEWLASFNTSGYGQFFVGKKHKMNRTAHKLAFELSYGPVPPGLVVMHTVCDNRKCCNPLHLKVGTHAENQAEKRLKGRAPKGERHYLAKLTPEKAEAIRSARRSGAAVKQLVEQFGIGKSLIYHVIKGEKWNSVNA